MKDFDPNRYQDMMSQHKAVVLTSKEAREMWAFAFDGGRPTIIPGLFYIGPSGLVDKGYIFVEIKP